MEWVLLRDRLPEYYKDVIVYTEFGETYVWHLVEDEEAGVCWETTYEVLYELATVTHWMNLPEKPEEVRT